MFIHQIKSFYRSGHSRSILIKKNVAASFIFQGLSVLIQFALVPLTLHYLNPIKFGIWITLSSFMLWFSFFDVGLSNGLKNKLSECIAKKEYDLAKTYISTTYALLAAIATLLFFIFLIIDYVIDWASVFHATSEVAVELNKVIFWVFTFFLLKFVLSIIGTVFTADQKPAYVNYFSFLANLLSLAIIFIVTKVTDNSLYHLGLWLSFPTVVVPLIASVYYFQTKLKHLSPSIAHIDSKKIKPLLSLGIYFFVSQLMTLIIYSSDNMIILQVLGPAEVTPYNIAFKYFSIVTILFGIAATPLWSAFTEAYSNNDFEWIRNAIKKFIRIWFLIIGGVAVMIVCSNYVYKIWIGNDVLISYHLTVSMGLFVIQNTWVIIFTYFVAGVGKMRLVTIILIFAGLLNIPMSIYFARSLHMGGTGVIAATILCLVPQCIIIPIQYGKIMRGTANGIWSK